MEALSNGEAAAAGIRAVIKELEKSTRVEQALDGFVRLAAGFEVLSTEVSGLSNRVAMDLDRIAGLAERAGDALGGVRLDQFGGAAGSDLTEAAFQGLGQAVLAAVGPSLESVQDQLGLALSGGAERGAALADLMAAGYRTQFLPAAKEAVSAVESLRIAIVQVTAAAEAVPLVLDLLEAASRRIVQAVGDPVVSFLDSLANAAAAVATFINNILFLIAGALDTTDQVIAGVVSGMNALVRVPLETMAGAFDVMVGAIEQAAQGMNMLLPEFAEVEPRVDGLRAAGNALREMAGSLGPVEARSGELSTRLQDLALSNSEFVNDLRRTKDEVSGTFQGMVGPGDPAADMDAARQAITARFAGASEQVAAIQSSMEGTRASLEASTGSVEQFAGRVREVLAGIAESLGRVRLEVDDEPLQRVRGLLGEIKDQAVVDLRVNVDETALRQAVDTLNRDIRLADRVEQANDEMDLLQEKANRLVETLAGARIGRGGTIEVGASAGPGNLEVSLGETTVVVQSDGSITQTQRDEIFRRVQEALEAKVEEIRLQLDGLLGRGF